MQYKIHTGLLATAFLRAFGIEEWRRLSDETLVRSGIATNATKQCDGYNIALNYKWQPITHKATLVLFMYAPGWEMFDQFKAVPNPAASIHLILKDLPETVFASIEHKAFNEIIDPPAWALEVLKESTAYSHYVGDGYHTLFGTMHDSTSHINAADPNDESPLTPDFEQMGKLVSNPPKAMSQGVLQTG